MEQPGEDAETLQKSGEAWELMARGDPLWAILTDPAKRGGRWSRDEFLATGEADVRRFVEHLARIPVAVSWGDALDFGCGVGRLSLALAQRFARVTGIDVAPAMIDRARAWNPHPERVSFALNPGGRLPLPDASFDFVLSFLVLQHIPADDTLGFVREFVRVLRPGGVAYFSVPARFWHSRGRQHGSSQHEIGDQTATMHMHAIPVWEVARALEDAGGEIVQIDIPPPPDHLHQATYIVRRAP